MFSVHYRLTFHHSPPRSTGTGDSPLLGLVSGCVNDTFVDLPTTGISGVTLGGCRVPHVHRTLPERLGAPHRDPVTDWCPVYCSIHYLTSIQTVVSDTRQCVSTTLPRIESDPRVLFNGPVGFVGCKQGMTRSPTFRF